MKIAPRIVLAVAGCGILLFGSSGLLQLRQEKRDLEQVARHEALLLGRSLQAAFESALQQQEIGDVTQTLGVLAQVDPEVRIYTYDRKGTFVAASAGARPSPDTFQTQARARATDAPVLDFSSNDAPRVLRVGFRLREPASGGPSAVVVLEKPLGDMQNDLAAERRSTLLTLLGFVLAITALIWVLTRSYVSRPLARLSTDMERVREGDYDGVEASQRQDEIGAIQRQFALLVRDLRASKARGDREFEARVLLERSLQQVDKLITLGQLAAVMAHEIGSPLQILEGRARALLKHADDAAATRRTAHMLVEQTERVTRIVSQMLSIAPRRPPVRTQVDAERSVRTVMALLELDAHRRGVQLRVKIDGRCDVFADPDQLQQVVLNLVRNALKASSSGDTVEVRLGGEAQTFVLEVADQGPGIPEAIRPQLFEPFFTTRAEHGGSGLGLSVVKAIVQEHAGHVSFPDLQPVGCVARVVLPRYAESAALAS